MTGLRRAASHWVRCLRIGRHSWSIAANYRAAAIQKQRIFAPSYVAPRSQSVYWLSQDILKTSAGPAQMRYTIAIDGPAASGKSTAAQKVSEELGYGRLDSGLLYRAITYILTRDGQALDLDAPPTKEKVEALVLTLKGGRLSYDGSDITDFLHTSAIDKVVGTVAKELYIREKTHRIQYEIINGPGEGIVVDGRDIGTVVIPDAFLKVFITAKDTTRAQRRLKDAGLPYDEVLRDIQERDYQDTHREHGPLKVADDAVVVENDEMTLKETVEHIVKLFKERKAKAAQ